MSMHAAHVLVDVAAFLRRAFLRQWDRNPQATLAVAVPVALVTCWLAWTAISAVLWPPQRTAWGSVYGSVTSVMGRPVADVMVVFVDDSAGVGASGRTDANGGYRAYGIRPGRYVVSLQSVVAAADREITREDVLAAQARLEPDVPGRFQAPATSGLTVELKRGRNRYDVDLRRQR